MNRNKGNKKLIQEVREMEISVLKQRYSEYAAMGHGGGIVLCTDKWMTVQNIGEFKLGDTVSHPERLY